MLCQFTFLTKTGATGKNHPPAASLKTNCNTKCVIEYTSLSAGIKRKALVIIALMSIGRCISYYTMTPFLHHVSNHVLLMFSLDLILSIPFNYWILDA